MLGWAPVIVVVPITIAPLLGVTFLLDGPQFFLAVRGRPDVVLRHAGSLTLVLVRPRLGDGSL
jgi:hypothetical protein